MKIVFGLLLLAVSVMATEAQAFGFENRRHRGACVSWTTSSNYGFTWYCTSAYTQLNKTAFNQNGQIRFLNTGLCLNASSPASVNVVACNGSSRQRWTFSLNGYRIYSAIYGSSNVLAGSSLGNGLWLSPSSDPYFNHDSRRWIILG